MQTSYLACDYNDSITTPGADVSIDLHRGQSICSRNDSYRLVLQTDGNLVLYRGLTDDEVVWTANTLNAERMSLQEDGNLVVYDVDQSPLWSTGTHIAAYSNQTFRLVVSELGYVYIERIGKGITWCSSNYDCALVTHYPSVSPTTFVSS